MFWCSNFSSYQVVWNINLSTRKEHMNDQHHCFRHYTFSVSRYSKWVTEQLLNPKYDPKTTFYCTAVYFHDPGLLILDSVSCQTFVLLLTDWQNDDWHWAYASQDFQGWGYVALLASLSFWQWHACPFCPFLHCDRAVVIHFQCNRAVVVHSQSKTETIMRESR